MAVFRAARTGRPKRLSVWEKPDRVACATWGLARQEKCRGVGQLVMEQRGRAEVVFDEPGELRWQHHRLAVERQVRVVVVPVEMPVGESNSPGDWKGVEADQGTGDALLQRQRGVVEASPELVLVDLLDLEVARELAGWIGDGAVRDQASNPRPAIIAAWAVIFRVSSFSATDTWARWAWRVEVSTASQVGSAVPPEPAPPP